MAKSSKKKTATTAIELEQKKNFSHKMYYYFFGILTFLLFVNSLGHGYNMDDTLVTNKHPLTSQGLSAIGEIFSSSYFSDNMGNAYGYRPIVHLSFAIEHELFGESPGTGHFINVLLYALCVIMLFKLLMRWLGEENIIIACIATVIFAVHPLHSEVVNSLKNRDELLAFLFIIWAGIQVHKYSIKQSILSLIGALAFVCIAMLAKKSIYPLTVVFPLALLFLNKVNLKQLIIISCTLIIPAAYIGSEQQITRMVLMIFLPIIVILACNYLLNNSKKESAESGNILQQDWFIPTLIASLVLVLYALTKFSSALLILAALLIILFYIKPTLGIIFSIISAIYVNQTLELENINFLILLISFSFGYHLKKQNAKPWLWIGIMLLGILPVFLLQFKWALVFLLIIIISFTILLFKNVIWSTLLIIVLSIAAFIAKGEIYFFTLIILAIALLAYFTQNNLRFKNIFYYVPICALAFLFISNAQKNIFNNKYNVGVTIETGQNVNTINRETGNAIPIKEGRQLHYVENTLVIEHSSEEKIATGFATLGEYLKLHLAPIKLSFYYGYSILKTENFKNPWVWISLILHLGLIVMAFLQRKKRPIIAIGILWYFACILLFSNWVELVAGMVGERLAFASSAGFAIFMAGIIHWISPQISIKKPGIIGALTMIVVFIFVGRTFMRNQNWKNTYTLMKHDIAHLENSAQANNMYAMTLMKESLVDKQLTKTQQTDMQMLAVNHFQKAVEICPTFFNAVVDLGRATMLMKNYELAVPAFEKAIEMDPTFYEPYTRLIEISLQTKDYERQANVSKALLERKKEPRTIILYAMGIYHLGDKAKSLEILHEGLTHFPNEPFILENIKNLNELP